ncbi:MAG TPA: RsiV family protein [Anaerolineales bacterium]|nr:RsiV family protein [Anaerolineales bacterium]
MNRNPNRAALGLAAGILVLAVLACGSNAPAQATATSASTPTTQPSPTFTPVPLYQVVSLVSTPTDETGKSPAYTVKAGTPFLQGSDDQRVVNFNNEMSGLTQEEIAKFRDNARVAVAVPGGGGSTYDQSYKVLSPAGNILSIKFDILIYIAGAAHPVSHSRTVTYDLEAGSDVTLDQLFLPNSNYLDLIANYCSTELGKRNIDFGANSSGAAPLPENYTNWNVTAQGLLITFDEYQVAAYVAGPQEVTVPYSELQSIIDPHGTLKAFLP